MAIATHRTENMAIAAARRQAIDEAAGRGVTSEAVALTDDGDTILFTATPDGRVSKRRLAGWIKTGRVNISQKIDSMVY